MRFLRCRMRAQPGRLGIAPSRPQPGTPGATDPLDLRQRGRQPCGSPVSSAARRSASNSRTRDKPSCASRASWGEAASRSSPGQLTATAPASSAGKLNTIAICPTIASRLVRRLTESASPMTRRSSLAMCATSCASTPASSRELRLRSRPSVRAIDACCFEPIAKALTTALGT